MRSANLGKISADIRPDLSKNNPRNSEGAFFTLKNSDILFAYSKFKGKSNADYASADICLLRSTDDGRTFGEEKTIMTCESEKAVNIMSLSFLEMANGDIGLFYLVRQTYTHMRMYLRRSADGGNTWSDRVLCMPEDGYYVVNNDRVRHLASGRILIPAARHAVAEGYVDARCHRLIPSVKNTAISPESTSPARNAARRPRFTAGSPVTTVRYRTGMTERPRSTRTGSSTISTIPA